MGEENGPAIGLDFGTSTTLIAAGDGIVWIGSAYPWLPSLVGFDDDGSVVVGEDARFARPGQVIRSIKRAITSRRNVVRVYAPAGLHDLRADDLIVEVLRKAERRATAKGLDLFEASSFQLGCPAMWDGRQRRRLHVLAQRAGLPLTLANLVDEPVAAGIAWLAGRPAGDRGPLRVLVFDMGGGTLDVAVLDVHGVDHHDISVLAAAGIAEAGDTLDDAIADDLDHALTAAGIGGDVVPRSEVTQELLLDAARTVKVGLTTESEYVVVLDPEVFGPNETWYTRQQLNASFAAQLDRAVECVTAVLRAARLTELAPGAAHGIARVPLKALVAGVDVVVLSGGMCRIPYVEQRLRALFPPTTRVELASTPPEIAVAVGLAKAAEYGRINRYRPAIEILLDWDQGRESRTIYEAYTPLVESWQIVRGDTDLRFIRDGRDLSLPRKGTGRLRCVSYSGKNIRASMDGDGLDGFPVALNGRTFEFSVYPSGHIRMVDGAGTHEGQVHDW